MKTQLLLTVEIDPEAERRGVLPPRGVAITPAALVEEINLQLRAWAHANPYDLRDPEHLSIKLAAHGPEASERHTVELGTKLASDLNNIATDLMTLSRLCLMTARGETAL